MSSRTHLKCLELDPGQLENFFKKMIKNTTLEQAFPPLKRIHFEFCKILNFGNHCKIMGKLRDRGSNGWISRNPGNLDPIPPKCLFLAVLKLARG